MRFSLKTMGSALALALAVVVVLSPASVRAWSKNEHAAIAAIAEKRLSDQARGKIRAILGDDVGLPKIASCADAIWMAQDDVNCGGAFRVPPNRDSVHWHFVPIPEKESPTPASVGGYCDQNCAMNKIKEFLAVLKKKDATLQERRVALLYVVHLVGDLHQPLHCVKTSADNDFGGTDMDAVFMDWGTNLHWLWDNAIETHDVESQKDPSALAASIDANFAEGGEALSGDVLSLAAVESFQLAKDVILPNYDQLPKEPKDSLGRIKRDMDIQYQQQMQPLAYRRMALAGRRLAYLLEDTLGDAPAAQPRSDGPASKVNDLLERTASGIGGDAR